MSKTCGKLLLVLSFFMLSGIAFIGFSSQQVYAKVEKDQLINNSKGVTGISAVPMCGQYCTSKNNCNEDATHGHQYFDVSFGWGTKCTGSHFSCTVLSWGDSKPDPYKGYLKPWCTSKGAVDCPTKSHVTSYSVSYIKDVNHLKENYINEFYRFDITTEKNSDHTAYQNVAGIIRRKVNVYKLKGQAVDIDTNAVITCNIDTANVKAEESGTISSSNCNPAGYVWQKWEDSSGCGTSRSCTQTNITADKTVKAYYKKSSYSLTAKAVDKNGNSLSSVVADRTKTGDYNTQVTVNKGSPAGYTFQNCWRTSTTGSCASTGDSYSTTLTSNATVYDVYEINRYTLTAKAVDVLGNSLSSLMADKSQTVNYNTKASVTVDNITGYTFKGFASSRTGTPSGTSKTYTVNNLKTNTTVYAVYERNVFEGKSTITGDASATAGWTVTGASGTAFIDNCSPTDGCTVTFKHEIKRKTGSGTTTYKVTRTSNLTGSDRGVANNNNVASGSSNENGTSKTVAENEIRLYPGMTVCEYLYFYPYNTSNATEVHTVVCASALGNAQPTGTNPDGQENPNSNSGDTSLINIKVRNGDVTRYNKYQREIYAKPGDNLTYRSTYFPNLQYTYYLIPEKMKINSGSVIVNSGSSLGSLYNNNKGSLGNWNNAYSVQLLTVNVIDVADRFAGNIYNKSQTPGITNRVQEIDERRVASSDVGNTIYERAITNLNESTMTTPRQVSFTKDNQDKVLTTVLTDSDNKVASAHVPYNYRNSTRITNDDKILYAGEGSTINYQVTVSPKTNNLTTNDSNYQYATKVDNAKSVVEICYNGNICNRTSENGIGTLNSGSTVNGVTENKQISLNTPDLPAGTEVRVRVGVYPANSGDDDNWSNPAGNGRWVWAEETFTVAKRPNLQVLGGNIYSRGRIDSKFTVKGLLYAYNDDNTNSTNINVLPDSVPYVFGSWGELGLVSAGAVNGFASGASLGYAENNNGVLWPNPAGNDSRDTSRGRPGGGNTNSLCKLNPLTFANCGNRTNGTVGSIGASTATTGIENDKNAIINKFIQPSEATTINGGEVELLDDSPNYYYSTNQLTITSALISKNQTKVVQSKAPIIISGNLIYNTESYTNLYEVPKLVIYAENNNIIINCNVTRIDAVLVANNVKTCNSDDINSAPNSTQLTINGAIIANSLTANRTYGAAQGVNSIVPAEIIDFDSTLYLWGGSKDSTETTEPDNTINGDLDVTYIHELAPRY